jgi:arginyl-tRNA--protein-N-Asp/Glu arginylyltransferase
MSKGKPKTKTKQKIKPEVLILRVYPILEQAITEGVNLGWNRAHKHEYNPAVEHIKECISDAVCSQMFEYFEINDGSKI